MPFTWKCQDGRVLTLAEMETKHIFNAMKMLFNHLAETHGLTPVGEIRRYGRFQQQSVIAPQSQAETILVFIEEIERRGDLPDEYHDQFGAILKQILPSDLTESEKDGSVYIETGDTSNELSTLPLI